MEIHLSKSEHYQDGNYSTNGRIPRCCFGILFGVSVVNYNQEKERRCFVNKVCNLRIQHLSCFVILEIKVVF